MTRRANWSIVEDKPPKPLVIRDVGPWNEYMSVTNAAEEVMLDLVELGFLPSGRRLFYCDSEGELDEILVSEGVFAGFAPGPR